MTLIKVLLYLINQVVKCDQWPMTKATSIVLKVLWCFLFLFIFKAIIKPFYCANLNWFGWFEWFSFRSILIHFKHCAIYKCLKIDLQYFSFNKNIYISRYIRFRDHSSASSFGYEKPKVYFFKLIKFTSPKLLFLFNVQCLFDHSEDQYIVEVIY